MQAHRPDMHVGVLIVDEGLEIVEASDRFVRDFECALDDVVGIELTELVSANDRRSLATLDRALSQATTTRIDLAVVLEVGEVQHLTRTLIEREGARWHVFVECIDGPNNLVFDLLNDQRRGSAVIDGASDGMVFLDRARRITDYNARFVEIMQFRSEHGVLIGEEALRGSEFERWIAGDVFAGLRTQIEAMWSNKGYSGAFRMLASLHDVEYVEFDVLPLFMPTRGLTGYAIALRDVTDRYRAEAERQARQREELLHREAIIAAQQAAIRVLSAPRIPVTKQLTVVPFVGEIDRQRMVEITQELLEGLARAGTRAVILDITGVPNLDEGAVAGLVSAGRALRMIGIRAVLTGVRPATAMLLAASEFSTHELEVRASLEDAIATLMIRKH